MTWPFTNNTNDVEKMLSYENMKVHRGRNLIIFISIFLTTIMLTGVLTTGFTFYNAELKYSDMSPGPGADGFAIMGTKEQVKKLEQYSDIAWAAMVQAASYKRIENPKTVPCDIQLLVTNETFYKNNYISLEDGSYPKETTDILISNTLAERLSLINPVGQHISFTVTVLESNEEVKKEIDFVICGLYKNPLSGIAKEYEEVYTSNDFIASFNPSILKKPSPIYIKLTKNLDKETAYERLYEINAEIGGYGVIAKIQEANNKETILLTVFAAILIMAAAYFIIFNVFSISLANDVHYYGMLKTIGATSKQIRSALNRQVYKILPFALLFGLLFGHGCGRWIAPNMLKLMDGLENFYMPSPILLPSFLAALFVFITVKISCWQSFRKVSKISSVDAVRFEPPKRKNIIFASLSLILSCIIFSSVFNFFFGYDVEKQVEQHNLYDFKLMNTSYLLDSSRESFEPISNELCAELYNLPFVNNIEILYAAHSQPDSYEDELGSNYYLRAKVKNIGKLAEDFEQAALDGFTYDFDIAADGDLRVPLCGVPIQTIQKTLESGDFKIIDGAIDLEKFAGGDYIIYQSFHPMAAQSAICAGDRIELQVFDNTTQQYKTKSLEVMAVVAGNDPYGRSLFSANTRICLLDKTFWELYPDYNQMIACVALDTGISSNYQNNYLSNYQKQQAQIQDLISNYFGYQITFFSKYNSILYYQKERSTYLLIGLFFAVFFSIISITNIANNIINHVLSRKLAYARMQAVGMTQKQLTKELIQSNLKVYILSILAFIPVEFFILIGIFKNFRIGCFTLSILLILLAVISILVIISLILTKYLNKKTIIQRFREIE